VEVYFNEEAEMYALALYSCWHLDRQVPSTAQFFNALSQILFEMEYVALENEERT
jgi:hypothetical protein